ncbi:MAG: hypothetical protein QOJ53_1941, partial [Sphingomonadales bacterium]|nr:hypothetical protein [Sphingomonadales bacterium]
MERIGQTLLAIAAAAGMSGCV